MKKARITLCWLPPAKPYLPSPSMTVLKQTLLDSGFEAQVIYWNILLEKIRKFNIELQSQVLV